MQECRYKGLKVYRYGSMQVCKYVMNDNYLDCKHVRIQEFKHASMLVFKLTRMQVFNNEINRYASM